MDRPGRRIVLAYAVALCFGLVVMFDKVGPWLAAKAEEAPACRAGLELGEQLHATLGLSALARSFDCAAASAFDSTYKNTYRCAQAATLEALGAGPEADPASVALPEGKPALAQPLSGDAPVQAAVSPLVLRSPGKVLVVGDSLAITLAISLERACKGYEGMALVAQGKVASGLQNPQYYNWEQSLRQLLAEHAPVLVVVMMGANDAKYLTLDPDADGPAAMADKRAAVYQARLAKFLRVLAERNIPSCWVGLPIMGDPELAAKSQALNTLARQACQELPNLRYLDTWPLLADQQGNYAHYLVNEKGAKVRVREGDKIHFSSAGGDIIARQLFSASGLIEGLKQKEGKSLADGTPTQPAKTAPAL